MNYEKVFANGQNQTSPASSENVQSSSAMNNRLEALKVLSQSLLREVEALKSNNKSEMEVIEEVKDGKIDLDKEVQKYEVELIRCALVRTGGRQRRAAKLLNVKISTLNAKIKRYGISTSGLDFALR
jgi:DNA-binding NtrC family response regulator